MAAVATVTVTEASGSRTMDEKVTHEQKQQQPPKKTSATPFDRRCESCPVRGADQTEQADHICMREMHRVCRSCYHPTIEWCYMCLLEVDTRVVIDVTTNDEYIFNDDDPAMPNLYWYLVDCGHRVYACLCVPRWECHGEVAKNTVPKSAVHLFVPLRASQQPMSDTIRRRITQLLRSKRQ